MITVDDFHQHQPVGNFLRSERSLIMHQKRSARFSEKFRDGVVAKVLSGSSSISSICQELEIVESDVIYWIADLMERKDQRIEELLQQLAIRNIDLGPHWTAIPYPESSGDTVSSVRSNS